MKTIYVLLGYRTIILDLQSYKETSQAGSPEPTKKASYKNLRQKTIAADSVEKLQVWRKSNGHSTYYPTKIPAIPPRPIKP